MLSHLELPHVELMIALMLALLVAALSVLARRLKFNSPILMLVAGTGLAFLPHIPTVRIDPELVLMVLLPPLLYSSGVGMSWRGFRANLRPILLLAVGCVVFTAAAVAVIVHYALGLSWGVGFVLGAIVSPPDAVAPMAVMRALRLPRRLVTVLEGESLVNDATALVTFGFALAAVTTQTFSLPAAVAQFLAIAAGEIGFGVVVGFAMLRLRSIVADPRGEVMLALVTPFIAFWPPHAVGGSGVIACVVAGLYVSWNGRDLISPATRLQGYFIWDLVVWTVEALIFLLAGLEAPEIAKALTHEGWPRAVAAGAIVSVAVIVVRFVWVYPANLIPRWLFPRACHDDPLPDWRQTFLVAFTGLRGAVSLAAALLIPTMIDGRPFPDRELVLFATFSVIVVTLVGLGTTLPLVVRALGIAHHGEVEEAHDRTQEWRARLDAIDAVLETIERDGAHAPHAEALQRWHRERREVYSGDSSGLVPLELRLLQIERESVARAYAEERLSDEARRRIERELDLEDARLRHALISATGAKRNDPA